MTPVTSTSAANAPIHSIERTLRADLGTQRSTFNHATARSQRSDLAQSMPAADRPPLSEAAQRRIRLVDAADHALDRAAAAADIATKLNAAQTDPAGVRAAADISSGSNTLAELALNEAEGGDPVESTSLEGEFHPIRMVLDAAKQLGRPVRLPGIAEMQQNLGMMSGATLEHGDLNADGRVDLDDFNIYATSAFNAWSNTPMENAIPSMDILTANYGKENKSLSQGDLDGDGKIGMDDFNLLAIKRYQDSTPTKPTSSPIISTPTASQASSSGTPEDATAPDIASERERTAAQRERAAQLRERIVSEDSAKTSAELLARLVSKAAYRHV